MKAYRHLVKYALKNNCTVSVWDGEEWQVKRSVSFKAIDDAINSVDEAQLRIRQGDAVVGWALVSNDISFEDDETVMDNTVNDFMNAWEESYDSNPVTV